MARPRKVVPDMAKIEETIKKAEGESPAIDSMPLESIRDYRLYNEEARRLNKKYRVCRYKIKQCPEELHPKQRVVATWLDGRSSEIPAFLSDANIEYDKKLTPGTAYDLPVCIIHHLENLNTPIWAKVKNKDGSYDSKKVGSTPRIALRTVYTE